MSSFHFEIYEHALCGVPDVSPREWHVLAGLDAGKDAIDTPHPKEVRRMPAVPGLQRPILGNLTP
jgi:hypothetical protein